MAVAGPPDGGFGWVILAVSSFCMSLIVGTTRIGGIVFYIVIDKFNVTRTEGSLILVMARLSAFCAAPITSKLLQKLTYSKLVCIGGLLASLGLILTSQANAFWQVVITYGFLLGSGMGFLLASTILIIGMYFKKRRSFAIGIYFTCGGIGSLVMPIIFGQLLDEFNFSGSLLILGAMMLHPCALSMLLHQPTWMSRQNSNRATAEKQELVETIKYVPSSDEKGQANGIATNGNYAKQAEHAYANSEPNEHCIMLPENGNTNNHSNKSSTSPTIYEKIKSSFHGIKRDFAIFKDLTFVLQLISRLGCTVAMLSMISYLPDYMKHEFVVPMTNKEVANILALSAVGDTLSRFTAGSLLEKLPWSKKYTSSMLAIIIGVIIFCLQEAKTMDTLLGCVIVYGLFAGSSIVVMMVLEAELMGPKKLPIAHGVSQLIIGVMSMVIGVLIGYVRDVQGSYSTSFYLLATFSIASGLVWFLEPLLIKCGTSSKEEPTNEDQSVVLNANVESAA